MVPIAFRPRVQDDRTRIVSAPLGHGHIAFTDLSSYGLYTCWILDNPDKAVGKSIYMPTFPTSLQDVADALTRVTGQSTIARDMTQEEWFSAVEHPRVTSSEPGEDDDMHFSYVHSFRGGGISGVSYRIPSPGYNLYQGTDECAEALDAEQEKLRPGIELADVIHPQRLKSVLSRRLDACDGLYKYCSFLTLKH